MSFWQKIPRIWVLFCPTFLSVKNVLRFLSCVTWLKLAKID